MYDITIDNICDSCFSNEDECGEYRECCYEGYLKSKINNNCLIKDRCDSMKGGAILMEVE